ncbi:hypothetical protein ACTXT7_012689 [Hymenolepis weldensis]
MGKEYESAESVYEKQVSNYSLSNLDICTKGRIKDTLGSNPANQRRKSTSSEDCIDAPFIIKSLEM